MVKPEVIQFWMCGEVVQLLVKLHDVLLTSLLAKLHDPPCSLGPVFACKSLTS